MSKTGTALLVKFVMTFIFYLCSDHPGVLIAAGEYFFHRYLLRSEKVAP